MRTRALVYLAGCVLASTACSSSGDSGGSRFRPGSGVCGQFSSELRVEDKFSQESTLFAPGEPIVFNLRITNNDDSPAMLGYDGCPFVRFVVSDSSNEGVFDNVPDGTACTLQLRTVDYASRETKEFPLEWNQVGSDPGTQVPAGQYTVNGRDRSVECAGELDRTGNFEIQ